MTTFVLIWFIVYSNRPTTGSHEFVGKEACETAKVEIMQWKAAILAVCVPKGGDPAIRIK